MVVMEKMVFGLDFRELAGRELLGEMEFQAVAVAHAKALWPNRALCLQGTPSPAHRIRGSRGQQGLEGQAKELVTCPNE